MSLKNVHFKMLQASRAAAAIGGMGIIFIAVIITIDVFLRKFAGTTIGGASEIAGLVFAVATAISYTYVLLDRANIRIDVLYTHLTPKWRAYLDFFGMLVFLIFIARLTYSIFLLVEQSWSGNTKTVGVIIVPLWIPQSLWFAGFALLTLTAGFLLVSIAALIIRRDWAMVNRIAGIPSIEETIEEDTHIEAQLADAETRLLHNKDAKLMAPLYIILAILALLSAAIPVGAVLGVLSLGIDEMYLGGRMARAVGNIYWEKSIDFLLLSAPLFIMLGEIMLRAGIARKMYNAVAQWLTWLPGGLMHANIATSALFAATSGSSVATTATIGVAAYPEIERHKYNEPLFMGSIAAGGTLGILIPPSVGLILFGILTETSIPELYLAGFLPGILLAAAFMLVILITCLVRRDWDGKRIETSWKNRFACLPDLAGPVFLFLAVVGSIYAGLATPTEAAAVGVFMALALAAFNGTLNWNMIVEASVGTMKTTGMIMFIVLTAMFLNFLLSFMGVTKAIVDYISALGLSPTETILVIVVFYLILGMFMETLAMMLTTVPLVFPIVVNLGVPEFTGVWFGILLTLLMEAGLITPPIGMNLYVAHGIRTRGGKFSDVAIGALPFLAPMLLMVALLIVFPQIATWLPNLFYR